MVDMSKVISGISRARLSVCSNCTRVSLCTTSPSPISIRASLTSPASFLPGCDIQLSYSYCGQTYYRLGKNAFRSGILFLCSLCADTLQATAVQAAMTKPKTIVFDFQFCGCAYHPPAGDQTCFG